MASQPANSDIQVFRRVRSYRDGLRHNSVKDLVNRMRPLIMSVPSQEVLIDETRDGSTIVATSVDQGKAGLPIVVFLRASKSLETAAEGISNLNFPIRIGSDKFLEKDAANLTQDLHQDLRDA